VATGVIISAAAGFFLLPRAAARKIDKSIAVLPFESLSDDKENAYFADGIQDDILTNLSKIGDLRVISRTSVMSYRGHAPNLREIGKRSVSPQFWKEVSGAPVIVFGSTFN
jgi:TolB-like protein